MKPIWNDWASIEFFFFPSVTYLSVLTLLLTYLSIMNQKQPNLTVIALLVSIFFVTGCNSTGSSTASAPIQVNKIGDGQMTCAQIAAEINEMNGILGIAEGEMRNAEMLGITQDVAINAALYSGGFAAAGSSLPYLGAAINAAGAVNNMNRQQAEARAEAAFNRRSVLTGMYAAKGCGQ
jgi:ABC-type transport system involved in multi-copper enzyme maturation permease subunit